MANSLHARVGHIRRIESRDFKWKRHKVCSTSKDWLTAFPFWKRVRQSSVATAGIVNNISAISTRDREGVPT